MRRSKSEIYLHFVWTTWRRQPWLAPVFERAVYRCIESEVQKLHGVVLSIGGMPDHVHLIVQMPTSLAPAPLMKQVKGVSSALINEHCEIEERFRWQENYGVFSLSRSHLPRAIKYVQHQKQRHARGAIWEHWEKSDEETKEKSSRP
jgi:REP element-mobilizing transposase RayT